jgi:hypothetical protein
MRTLTADAAPMQAVVARVGAIPSVATAARLCGGDSATAVQALRVLAWYGSSRAGVRALTMDATVLPTVVELLRADPLRPSNAILLLKLIRHVDTSPSTSAALFSGRMDREADARCLSAKGPPFPRLDIAAVPFAFHEGPHTNQRTDLR